MSSAQKDRKVRTGAGSVFPDAGRSPRSETFPDRIAQALRRSFGHSPGAVKTVARLTGGNERAVRNWFEGRNAPSAENLVILMRHSDEVLETVMLLASRPAQASVCRLASAKGTLKQMLALVEDLDLA